MQLVCALQDRRRELPNRRAGLDAQSFGSNGYNPFGAIPVQRCTLRSGILRDHISRIGRLFADHRGHSGLLDCRLLAGNCRQGLAQELHMVHRDRGDRGQNWSVNYIGRVVTPAQTAFQ